METALSCSTANLYQPEVLEITPLATSRNFAFCHCCEPLMIHSNHNHSDVSGRQPEKHWTAKACYSVYMMLHNSSLTVVNNFITSPIMFVNSTAFPAGCLLTMSNEAVDSSHKQYFICWHRNCSSHNYFLSSSSWTLKYHSSFFPAAGSSIKLSSFPLWSNKKISPIKLYQQQSFILPHWS